MESLELFGQAEKAKHLSRGLLGWPTFTGSLIFAALNLQLKKISNNPTA
tara:strand:+ start:269 stop:415 length:147 start_codon:yes stop_codon:yes gene_type:complete